MARAQESLRVELAWEAPETCIARDELIRRLRTELGSSRSIVERDAELRVAGRIDETTDGTFHARLVLSAPSGHVLGSRELDSEGSDCATLDQALVVVLAVMLNIRREDIPAPVVQPSRGWRLRVAAGAGVLFGLLPGPGLEVSAEIGAELRGAVRLGVELSYMLADTASCCGGQLAAGAAAARVLGAPVLYASDDIEIALELSAGAGPMWAEAFGFPINFTRVAAWIDVRGGLRASGRVLEWLWLEAAADAGWVALRPRFSLRNVPEDTTELLFRPLPVEGVFSVGLVATTD